MKITDGITTIGSEMIPGRKKPAIVVQKGNETFIYGYFKSEMSAFDFMNALSDMVGAKPAETYCD